MSKKVYIFEAPEEAAELLESMSKHVEGGIETSIINGLILFGLFLQSSKNNCKLAIIDENDNIIKKIEKI